MKSDGAAGLVIKKLSRFRPLGPDEREALEALNYRIQSAPANHVLVREGDIPDRCCVLVDGYACRHKSTKEGGRQIVSFHLPGDILDIQHLQLPVADHNVETITSATVAWVPCQDLLVLLNRFPAINDALWRDALVDASVFREWVLNVGRRNAKIRIAHMLCEFAARREAAGLGSPERFELPMTQDQIADATGLTNVHVNRSLAALTAEGVIQHKGRLFQITDWERMQELADFDPAYLHEAA